MNLRVGSGPPLAVNSSEKVAGLNADQIDGKDESAFLGKTEKAADSDKLDGKDSSGYVQTDTNKFIRNNMFEYTSDLSTGTLRTSDGTYSIDMPCPSSLKTNPNYSPRLLSGGFRDIDPGTTVLESYPTFTTQGEVWRVRILNNSTLDEFRVVVKCTDQRP